MSFCAIILKFFSKIIENFRRVVYSAKKRNRGSSKRAGVSGLTKKLEEPGREAGQTVKSFRQVKKNRVRKSGCG